MSDNTVMKTMLLDFYGELLTDKQREYYDLHYNNDLSLYEIAEQSGVSRQAVWDIIRRADAILVQTEEKTGFVAKAIKRSQAVEELQSKVDELSGICSGETLNKVQEIKKLLSSLED